MTLRQVQMVLERAVQTLDHFPSISQLKEIADRFQTEKPEGYEHGRPRLEIVSGSACKTCGDDGYILADRRDMPSLPYIFKCPNCARGRSPNFLPKSSLWSKDFEWEFKPRSPRLRISLVEPESPWPMLLSALMELMAGRTDLPEEKREKAYRAGLTCSRVSEEEAWELLQLYSERKWDDPLALKVISRTRGQSVSDRLTEVIIKKRSHHDDGPGAA